MNERFFEKSKNQKLLIDKFNEEFVKKDETFLNSDNNKFIALVYYRKFMAKIL